MIVYLIGFMGSGKSYVGKKLAPRLEYAFLDLDEWTEHQERQEISKIFATKGEAYFRAKEREYLEQTAVFDDIIISTGGGAPCFFDNMDFMNRRGITVYLKTPVELLFERLKSGTEKRPLLQQKSDAELRDFITQKMAERTPFYEQAAFIYEQKENSKQIIFDIENYLSSKISH